MDATFDPINLFLEIDFEINRSTRELRCMYKDDHNTLLNSTNRKQNKRPMTGTGEIMTQTHNSLPYKN